MISLQHLHKTFSGASGPVRALDDVSIEVGEGEIFGVVGQSGAGKSTLIRTVNLLERPDSGSVTVDGRDLVSLDTEGLRAARHDIGMVFQQFHLLQGRTAHGNVELALEIAGVDRAERRRRAGEILELVGLSSRADSYPAQLSGGQKQRVGIARALASNPKVLLSDEATSALDPETTRSILDLIKTIRAELGLTVLLITHEMDVIKRICDSAALLESGRIIEQGRLTEVITTPGSRLAADLFPLHDMPAGLTGTVVDITFAGGTADRPVIAQLARTHGFDVSVLGAAIETIGGKQAGRTRLEIPGAGQRVDAAIADLRGQDLLVEVVHAPAASPVADPAVPIDTEGSAS